MKHIKLNLAVLSIISLFLLSFAGAQESNMLDEDCDTYNLNSACRPTPAVPKVVSKPAPKILPRSNFIKDELLLLYPSDKATGIKKITQKYNLKPLNKVVLSSVKTGMLVAKTNGQNALNLSKAINQREKSVKAATNNTFHPTTSTYKKAYSMYETGVSYVHETTKGRGVTICMIDTPVDIFHPSLSNSLIETSDLIDFDPKDYDSMLHGTTVAGVLVSQNKYIGIAPKAKLFAISAISKKKTNPYTLQGTTSNIARAIDSCIRHKVDVINMSFTGGEDSLVEKLVIKAIQKGIIVVASGGNGGHWGSTIYPALIPGVIATTAVDENKKLFSMADKGHFIDLAAPGVNVLSIAPGGKYKLVTGTSISSAHVSGVVALLLSNNKNAIINKILADSAIDLGKPGRDPEYGEGLISASRALAIIKKSK